MNSKHKIGFVGLGLIDGSIAKAIRQYYPNYEIVAFDKNKDNIVNILDNYIALLEETSDTVANSDEQNIYNLFESSKNYRNSIPGGSSGPIKRMFAIYCDIIDEASSKKAAELLQKYRYIVYERW